MDQEIDRQDLERQILARGKEATQPGGHLHDFANEWWFREEHQRMIGRERDIAFQIKMLDWLIILFLVVLVGVIAVGIWAVVMM